MKPTRLAIFATGMLLSLTALRAVAAGGYATRDLNPILQPVFLPAYISLDSEDSWRIDHSLFITNTHQDQSRGGESLIIDVENTRYELDFGYRHDDWVVLINLPFIASRGGELDGLIEDWHDFWGFPEGDRGGEPRDQIEIEYRRDGALEYSQTESSSGLADVSLSLGHHPRGEIGYFIGIELPTGSESDFSGNEAIDIALWIIADRQIGDDLSLYGLFGLSLPGDDGAIEGLIGDRIWVAQAGLDYRFTERIVGIAQLDYHSASIEDSDLRAFGDSFQIQLGLGFERLFGEQRLDLFFSEDILVGSAPDISFGARLRHRF